MATQLLAFKAGKSFRRESSNLVDPVETKGLIIITRGEDELLHFQWQNRTNGEVEDVRSTRQSVTGRTNHLIGPHNIPTGSRVCKSCREDLCTQVLIV